ncbi:DUF190 domain-containing protein [Streptomyces sp. NPDC026206]|uniref:DUF190 domain-containing protein n=1 Tax=Streptomyces sp. NPDC026206 TaxID=3157089 RepID=UPI0033E06560
MTSRRLVPACRLTLTVLSGTLWRRKPLYSEIVRRAHHYGLGGAGVFQGIEGFGSDGVINTTRLLSMSDRLPLLIVATDEEPKIYGFLDELDPAMDIESAAIDHVRLAVRDSPKEPGP